jgi:tellurite resistance protein TehA-like permease
MALSTLTPGKATKIFSPFHSLAMGIHNVSPGWFTSVMGTGILAICMALSPYKFPFFEKIDLVLWISDVILFGILLLFWLLQSLFFSHRIRASLHDAAHAQLWGHLRWPVSLWQQGFC